MKEFFNILVPITIKSFTPKQSSSLILFICNIIISFKLFENVRLFNLQLEKYHISLFRFFCRKNDMNDPPMTEEGTVEEGEDVNVDEVEHKRNLDGRFFQYGIKPEWLQIHRILWHK